MNNKTCGECQWYDYHHLLCVVGGDVKPTDCVCDSFIPIKRTNGDKIRQMSNEELLQYLAMLPCEICPVTKRINGCEKNTWDGETRCQQNWLDWLNATAESEGKR